MNSENTNEIYLGKYFKYNTKNVLKYVIDFNYTIVVGITIMFIICFIYMRHLENVYNHNKACC
jgi:hypothetical protein